MLCVRLLLSVLLYQLVQEPSSGDYSQDHTPVHFDLATAFLNHTTMYLSLSEVQNVPPCLVAS